MMIFLSMGGLNARHPYQSLPCTKWRRIGMLVEMHRVSDFHSIILFLRVLKTFTDFAAADSRLLLAWSLLS